MAEVKAAQADTAVERPDRNCRIWLIYGPDAGLVSERADVLSRGFGVDLGDPFSLIRMDADAAAELGRLADEAQSIGMFGGGRLIRVSGSTRRNLADAIRPLIEAPPVDCWLIIEAGDLKRDSALRKLVEKSPVAMAVPCFPDNDRDLDRLIGSMMAEAGLTIEADARQVLKSHLGSDRRISRAEIAKLALYCEGRKSIRLADVNALIGDSSAVAADDLIDAAISGDAKSLDLLLPRLASLGVAGDMVLMAALRHFQLLQVSKDRMATTRAPAQAVTASLRPPLHFSRKAAFEQALARWQPQQIAKALARLDKAVFEARANSALSLAIAGAQLMTISLEARKTTR